MESQYLTSRIPQSQSPRKSAPYALQPSGRPQNSHLIDVPFSPAAPGFSHSSAHHCSELGDSNQVLDPSISHTRRGSSVAILPLDPQNNLPYPGIPSTVATTQQSNVRNTSEADARLYHQSMLTRMVSSGSMASFKLPASSHASVHTESLQAPQQNLQQQRSMSDEEHQLATKLKETYKNIVSYEEIVQKNCIEISAKISLIANSGINAFEGLGPGLGNPSLYSSSRTAELLHDLWTVYHHNVTLLENYYDFLVAALKPVSSTSNMTFKTGRNVVELYKIPRRMWVYGIVGFLEVLKNIMSIFQDHEICLCFIAYCFNVVSMLTDPNFEMEGWWLEKLGDLSRMAIALYASKFIDWKISAEYWYAISMKTLYGHGKIYYHMSTVQQDNLEALVNIGKSVICRDPFVPTQNYLRLVVENICTQRNALSILELPIIDFIKIHKVLLSIFNRSGDSQTTPESIHDSQVQYGIDLVTRYGLTFGSDSNGYNFFTSEVYSYGSGGMNQDQSQMYMQQYLQHQNQPSAGAGHPSNMIEKTNFWFHRGASFAIANINHLVGFGDPRNPFARILRLPEALKERRDKKDRKRKGRVQNPTEDISGPSDNASATDLSVFEWYHSLQYINKLVLELSIRILNHYLIGPKAALMGHVIVWLYFLISIGRAMQQFPKASPMFSWIMKKLFPWESLINYLNDVLEHVKATPQLSDMCAKLTSQQTPYLQYFNENENLSEVWKCWGTLWFDFISEKGDYNTLCEAGVANDEIIDLLICGTNPLPKENNPMKEYGSDDRIVRVVLLARSIADDFGFGLTRTETNFKYDESTYNTTDNSITESKAFNEGAFSDREVDPNAYMEDFMLGDGRFVQNNFLRAINPNNLSRARPRMTPQEIDMQWFKPALSLGSSNGDNESMSVDVDSELREDQKPLLDREHPSLRDPSDFPVPTLQLRFPPAHQFASFGGLYQEEAMIDQPPGTAGTTAKSDGNLGDRIDTRVTYITLDTNIWLKHCGRIFKCIRNRVFKTLIPLIVFQELRALRKSTEATIADAATRLVIIVRELYATREIIPLRFDGTVALDINETLEFEKNSNWRSNVDDTILNLVGEHDEIARRAALARITVQDYPLNSSEFGLEFMLALSPKAARLFKYCVLITDDRNMRLRAKTVGLTSFQSKWLFSSLEQIASNQCID